MYGWRSFYDSLWQAGISTIIANSLVTISSVVLIWQVFSLWAKFRLIGRIPGPKAYPIVGNLFEVMMSTTEIPHYLLRNRKKYGPIIRWWFGPIPVVFVGSAELVEPLFASTEDAQKGVVAKALKPWLGEGLLLSSGPRWSKHRKLITPTFHYGILENFVQSFQSSSQGLVEKLKIHAEKGDYFDILPDITSCALDIICETAMGVNLQEQDSMDSEYVQALHKISHLIPLRLMRFYLFSDFIYGLTSNGKQEAECVRILHAFTNSVIRKRREERKQAENSENGKFRKKKQAFLDLLLDSDSDITDTEIREEVDTFMFEGHDTVAAAITWTIYLLGRHTEIQDRIAEEISAVWPKEAPLTIAVLKEMKYLERAIKEALRMFPSVPNINRQAVNDIKIGQYKIPAGTQIGISIFSLHRDESVFPDPDKFDPDRFLLENAQKRHPYAFVPFSAGTRNCIGQKFAMLEGKTVIASLLREYKIKSAQTTNQVILDNGLTLKSGNGIITRIFSRI